MSKHHEVVRGAVLATTAGKLCSAPMHPLQRLGYTKHLTSENPDISTLFTQMAACLKPLKGLKTSCHTADASTMADK